MWRWRSKAGDDQVRKALRYFSDTDLTWSPHLGGFVLHAPSGAFLAFPPLRALACIGLELEALLGLVVDFQQAMRAFLLLLLFTISVAWRSRR